MGPTPIKLTLDISLSSKAAMVEMSRPINDTNHPARRWISRNLVILSAFVLPLLVQIAGEDSSLLITLSCFLALLAITAAHQQIEQWARRHPRSTVCAIILVSLAIAWRNVGPGLFVPFYCIDDTLMLGIIGAGKNHLTPDEAFRILQHNLEFGAPDFLWKRYRPSYWLMKVWGAMVWGANPNGWWIEHLIFLTTLIAIVWTIARRWCGIAFGGMVAVVFLAAPYWSYIWDRLGTSERIASPAVAIFLLGAFRICIDRRAGWISNLCILVGGAIAMGAKENFLCILPVTWYMAWLLWTQNRLRYSQILMFLLLHAIGAWIAYVIMRALGSNDTDLYDRPVAAALSIRNLIAILASRSMLYLTAMAMGTAILTVLSDRIKNVAWADSRVNTTWWSRAIPVALLLSTAAFQLIFYRTPEPPYRYAFPFRTIVDMSAIAFAFTLARLIRRGLATHYLVFRVMLRIPAELTRRVLAARYHFRIDPRVVVACWLLLSAIVSGTSSIRTASAEQADRVNAFNQRLSEIEAVVNAKPDRPIVFVVSRPGEMHFETSISLQSFLRFRNHTNQMILQIDTGDWKYDKRDLAAEFMIKLALVGTQQMLEDHQQYSKYSNQIVSMKMYQVSTNGFLPAETVDTTDAIIVRFDEVPPYLPKVASRK